MEEITEWLHLSQLKERKFAAVMRYSILVCVIVSKYHVTWSVRCMSDGVSVEISQAFG